MHIHILGICGTFMGGVAALAQEAGHVVTGCDSGVYPPMSTQLEGLGIELIKGYDSADIPDGVDEFVIGNAISRGNKCVEHILDHRLAYSSGPEWLYDNILRERWVLCVAGTHGKTTVTSMLASILEYAGMRPGFLVGGIPADFSVSARLGEAPFFIVEADEYDTAFFDKRSKFVHYQPRTLILNNLEFDHADIFKDLEAIKTQFHFLMRTVPSNALVVANGEDNNVSDVLERGCWTPVESFGANGSEWNITNVSNGGRDFDVNLNGIKQSSVGWDTAGAHNRLNALAAIAAARHAGVPVEQSCQALGQYKGVKRRLEVKGIIDGITVYDDFAHHPTAIRETIDALRERVGEARIFAVLEPRSNTMKMGFHKNELADSLKVADQVLLFQPQDLEWDVNEITDTIGVHARGLDSIESIVNNLVNSTESLDHILIMSNGSFDALHDKLLKALSVK